MRSLREIDLSRTKITDLALPRLSTLQELNSVQLEDTFTSKSGAHTLHADLTPNCTVFAADGTCLVAAKYRN
jgi:hypothetical protein